MVTQPTETQNLEMAIYKALEGEVHKIKEIAINEAMANFEAELRKSVGLVAIRLADYYSIERMRGELLIHVKMEKEK